jgi:hypothetical protein
MRELWDAACNDAGFRNGPDAVLELIDGQPPGGPQQSWAVWLAPKTEIAFDANYPLTAGRRAALNEPGPRAKHRVIAFSDIEPEILLGYLRHELEHARQYLGNQADFAYSPLVMLAIAEQLGDLDGTGGIYNLMPRELDANAAAAALIRGYFGPQPSARYRGLHAALFRPSEPPGDIATLFFRTFCFMFKEGLDAAFKWLGPTKEDFFRAQNPRFVEAWDKLEKDARLTRELERAYKSVPSRKAIRAAGDRPGDAWSVALRRFESANKLALAALDWT